MKKSYSLLILCLLTGCTTTHQAVLDTNQTQIQRRNYQSRYFSTNDKNAVMRGVVAVMQDLDFIIDKADYKLGIISGNSFVNPSAITVSVREMNENQILVRLNAQVELKPIEDPIPYQNFFNALEKTLFLEASQVSD